MILLSIFLSLLGLTHQDLHIPNEMVIYQNDIVDLYDFEVDGMYYAYLSDSTVQVVRKSSLLMGHDPECNPMEYYPWLPSYEFACNYEGNLCYSGDIVIPDSVNYNGVVYQVVGINPYAFSCSPNLTSIVLGKQKVYSGFNHCKRLKSIVFTAPIDSLTNICHACDSLPEVFLPEGIQIMSGCFNFCPSLGHLDIPNSVTKFVYMGGDLGNPVIDFVSRDSVRHKKVTFEGWMATTYNKTIRKMVFPECDTLHFSGFALGYSHNVEEMRYRNMKVFIKDDWESLVRYFGEKYVGYFVSESVTPPEVIYTPANGKSDREHFVVYVPDESVEAYRAAPYWEEFKEVRSMTQYDEEMAAAMIGVSSDTTDAALICTSLGTTLSVECPIATSLDIWTMQGQRVWHGDIAPDAPASVNLPHDIYILTANGHSTKVCH